MKIANIAKKRKIAKIAKIAKMTKIANIAVAVLRLVAVLRILVAALRILVRILGYDFTPHLRTESSVTILTHTSEQNPRLRFYPTPPNQTLVELIVRCQGT